MAKKIYGTLELVPLSNSKALAVGAGGAVVEATTTAAELDFLSGTTSAVQTQLDAKEATISSATAEAVASTDTIPFTDVSDSNNTKKITFANIEAALSHDSLADYVANEHIDHTSVSITTAAESGLTGGGDISATRTLSVDITGTSGATLAGTDELLIYDVSGSVLAKVTAQDIADLAAGHPVSHFKDTWVTADTATKAITHSLGTADVMVNVYDVATGETIIIDTLDRTDTNTVTVTASEAPPAGNWRVLILALG